MSSYHELRFEWKFDAAITICHARRSPIGAKTGDNMVKLIFCLRRLLHLSREQFQKYWLETHGPLVRERAAAIGAIRYVQLHTGHDDVNAGLQASRGGLDPYDGVAKLWYEDWAIGALMGSPLRGRASGPGALRGRVATARMEGSRE